MHCKGHNRDGSKVAEGNQLGDCEARKAALYQNPSLQMPLIWTGPMEQEKPQNNEEELERYEKRGAKILLAFQSLGYFSDKPHTF